MLRAQVAIGLNGLLAALEVPGLTQLHSMLRAIPESATEAALDNLKNPQSGGVLAQAIGAVGPVLTGPIWEEVLYRGFLLSALALYMSVPTAVDVAALIFALNHMNARHAPPATPHPARNVLRRAAAAVRLLRSRAARSSDPPAARQGVCAAVRAWVLVVDAVHQDQVAHGSHSGPHALERSHLPCPNVGSPVDEGGVVEAKKTHVVS